ncbi:hypothetical protein Pan241w_08150 [Gimesia alba]|uniref:Uncharacterized protein n=1 Tax=Gimesia alba TaxID=2527973 RepID=A0A517RA44_9PLAN|nr:hypothetical protein [Gimesia alba]QDT40756.1 hypothetical protein Pan241w_08150 [Gimesia alba]
MKRGILGVIQVLVLAVLFNAYAFNFSVESFEVSSAEASSVFGGVTCNGQELKNRCGNTETTCDAPNDANFCDASTVGQSCVSAGGGGQYEGTGSAFGCIKTGAAGILCYGTSGPDQECDATTICVCKKPFGKPHACVKKTMNWKVKESAKTSTTNCTEGG